MGRANHGASGRGRRRGIIVAVVAAVAVGGTVVASAATLGSLNSNQIGTSSANAAACTSAGLTTSYVTSYVPSTNTWNVTGVKVSGATLAVPIPATCGGQTISVAVSNGSSSATGSATLPGVPANPTTVTLTTPVAGYDGNSLTQVSVTIAQ